MSKEEIIERLEEIAKHAVHVLGEKPFFMSLDDGIAIHEAIDILKSAQPEIIRCKGCRHGQAHNPDGSIICEHWDDNAVTDDDFCSRAERKE